MAIADLDPQKLAQREIQQKAEIANMAIKFAIAVSSGPSLASFKNDAAAVFGYTITLAERLHRYVTSPSPGVDA
jgi:hypothetical protein